MPIIVGTILLSLLVCAVGTLVYWCVVLYHVMRTRSSLPTARDGANLPEARAMLDDPAHAPRVCIVVPAHNERENIGSFVDSALAQSYPHLGVVLCLDRCTDDTLDIAARHGSRAGSLDPRLDLRVITSCPADWAGKVHAIHRGVTDSPLARSADILLFADADTTMDKDLVVASVALMRTRRLGMLSLLSTMTHGRWFEDMVQPAAGM